MTEPTAAGEGDRREFNMAEPKPSFIIIGAQKAGTTFLYDRLRQHSEVFMPPPPDKELYFFSHKYENGWKWYLNFFRGAAGYKAIGEATPEYTANRSSNLFAERMYHHLPDVRLIYIVRHPIERLVSCYVQYTVNGLELPPISEALREFGPIVEGGCYWSRLSSYLRFYPPERILCLFLEDVNESPDHVLRACWGFLGVDESFMPDDIKTRTHTREGQVTDRAFLWSGARRLPWYDRLRRSVPQPIVKAMRRLIKKPIHVDATLNPADVVWAAERFSDEARRFLDFAGRDPGFWDLSVNHAVSRGICRNPSSADVGRS